MFYRLHRISDALFHNTAEDKRPSAALPVWILRDLVFGCDIRLRADVNHAAMREGIAPDDSGFISQLKFARISD